MAQVVQAVAPAVSAVAEAIALLSPSEKIWACGGLSGAKGIFCHPYPGLAGERPRGFFGAGAVGATYPAG